MHALSLPRFRYTKNRNNLIDFKNTFKIIHEFKGKSIVKKLSSPGSQSTYVRPNLFNYS
jgi:hypothetical protein